MKNNLIICFTAALLVLASVAALSGCMFLVGESDSESKLYNPDEMSLPSVIEETPTAQLEMQKKFSAYGYEETREGGGKILNLFTKEQVDEAVDCYLNDVDRDLSYEEFLFIINDSIRMYFEYDEIILPDYRGYWLLPSIVKRPATDKGGIDEFYSKHINAGRIIPYHGDFSEFDTDEEKKVAYYQMLSGIVSIISTRMFVHGDGESVGDLEYDKPSLYYLNPYGDDAVYRCLPYPGGNRDYDSCFARFIYSMRDGVAFYRGCVQADEDNTKFITSDYTVLYFKDGGFEMLFPTKELNALYPVDHVELRIPDLAINGVRTSYWTDMDIYRSEKRFVISRSFETESHTIEGNYEIIGNDEILLKCEDGSVRLRLTDDGFEITELDLEENFMKFKIGELFVFRRFGSSDNYTIMIIQGREKYQGGSYESQKRFIGYVGNSITAQLLMSKTAGR